MRKSSTTPDSQPVDHEKGETPARRPLNRGVLGWPGRRGSGGVSARGGGLLAVVAGDVVEVSDAVVPVGLGGVSGGCRLASGGRECPARGGVGQAAGDEVAEVGGGGTAFGPCVVAGGGPVAQV